MRGVLWVLLYGLMASAAVSAQDSRMVMVANQESNQLEFSSADGHDLSLLVTVLIEARFESQALVDDVFTAGERPAARSDCDLEAVTASTSDGKPLVVEKLGPCLFGIDGIVLNVGPDRRYAIHLAGIGGSEPHLLRGSIESTMPIVRLRHLSRDLHYVPGALLTSSAE